MRYIPNKSAWQALGVVIFDFCIFYQNKEEGFGKKIFLIKPVIMSLKGLLNVTRELLSFCLLHRLPKKYFFDVACVLEN